MNPLRRLATSALVAVILATLTAPNSRAVTIDWVTVGNPGNANDDTGYGAVGYEYQIGKYEVTIQQYTDFLNAAAKTDPYSLYNPAMGTNLNIAGISRSGTDGGYSYSVIGPSGATPAGASSPGNRPITYVSWFDAARFANWMQNGQGTGSTETGAYTLGGATSGTAPAKNPGAQFYIPTENEWYKAAYYSPVLNSGSGGYYRFATQSNTAPGNSIGDEANEANYAPSGVYSLTQTGSYSASQNYLTDVGAFANSASYYGTFDQSGNASEWNDLTGAADSYRGIRGGAWNDALPDCYLRWMLENIIFTGYSDGFRLASPVVVPEPSTYAMALAGLTCGGYAMFRRRNRA